MNYETGDCLVIPHGNGNLVKMEITECLPNNYYKLLGDFTACPLYLSGTTLSRMVEKVKSNERVN